MNLNRDELPRVLAITRDMGFLRALRLEAPLLKLQLNGHISSYFITNPTLFDVPDDLLFDVVWLQRVSDGRLLELLQKKNIPYMYDLDDLLLAQPSYRAEIPGKQAVLEAVKHCSVLTTSSHRLTLLVKKYVGCPLEGKTVVCPNALEFPPCIKQPTKPSGLLLTSSDDLPLLKSKQAIFSAVERFRAKHHLPLYYFGPQQSLDSLGLHNVTSPGRVTLWHYYSVLAALPTMMGICPLETDADSETMDFINGKSDIKMLGHGGHGHPSVYSNSLPYTDTDLKSGIIVENTERAWYEALEILYEHGWSVADQEQQRITEQRNMDTIAGNHWRPAIMKARTLEPLRGADLKTSTGKLSFFIGAAKHILMSQDHETRQRILGRLPESINTFVLRSIT